MIDGYPHLAFRRRWEITPKARYELGQCHAMILAICKMPLRPEDHSHLLGVSLVKGAQATTAIEGNTLTTGEIERVVAGESLPPSKEYQEIEVRNVLEAMNALLTEVATDEQRQLITPELILRFHTMIGKDLGPHFDAIPGKFRSDNRVVGPYRCPDPDLVPALVDQLTDWLPKEFLFNTGTQPFADAVVQAIVTHVYIEWIHPFGDGNGRTGRLLEFYILLRAGTPDIGSHILANFYNTTRPEYYRQLEKAAQSSDLTEFIEYAVEGFRDGLFETLETIQEGQFEMAWRSFVYDKFADRRYTKRNVFKRRRELMLSFPVGQQLTMDELSLVTPNLARAYAQLSERTLSRDLQVLEEMDLVERDGKRFRARGETLKIRIPRRIPTDLR
jgi:Fic family protein